MQYEQIYNEIKNTLIGNTINNDKKTLQEYAKECLNNDNKFIMDKVKVFQNVINNALSSENDEINQKISTLYTVITFCYKNMVCDNYKAYDTKCNKTIGGYYNKYLKYKNKYLKYKKK